MFDLIKSAMFGLAVGDALGVPVEFKSREAISLQPVTNMTGYGTYDVPPGTWSDDSSLTFCLAEALTREFSIAGIADNFQQWLYNNYWTAHGEVFDVGISTRKAINNLRAGIVPELAGGFFEEDNGNGSLMRILPLVFYTRAMPIDDRYTLTKQVSSLTHGHIRSVIACFYYLEFARGLINKEDKNNIYRNLRDTFKPFLESKSINSREIQQFGRLLDEKISDLHEDQIRSSGYGF